MNNTGFRYLLGQQSIICLPGAFDAWSARLIEQAGFPAVYMTGYGVSASVLGQPDIGLITLTEMADQARNIASVVGIPVVADGDTGYGDVLNVMRTVREYEQAGVAAIQLEDQELPKRCGHMEGKQLISTEQMTAKIRAAADARRSEDFCIIARTDARAVEGFAAALARAQAYVDAGADAIFLEAPQSLEEMIHVPRVVKKPCLANMVENGKTPYLTVPELAEVGYKIVIFPATLLYAASKSMLEVLEVLKTEGNAQGYRDRMLSFPEFNTRIGLDKMRSMENNLLQTKS